MAFYGPSVTDPTGMAQLLAGPSASASGGQGKGLGGFVRRIAGAIQLATCTFVALSLLSWSVTDPSLTHIASGTVRNWMGPFGAIVSDLLVQLLGVASIVMILPPAYWALLLADQGHLPHPKRKLAFAVVAVLCLALAVSSLPEVSGWPLRHGYGGGIGDILYARLSALLSIINATRSGVGAGLFGLAVGCICFQRSFGLSRADMKAIFRRPAGTPRQAAANFGAAASLVPHDRSMTMTQAWVHPPAPAQGFARPDAAITAHQFYPPQPAFEPQPSAGNYNAAHPQSAWHTPPPPSYVHSHVSAPLPQSQQPFAPAPARQAWLRPMHRPQPAAATAVVPPTESAERLSAATDRRHAPAFDRETDQQSRAIAERFAPSATDAGDIAYAPAIRSEPTFAPVSTPLPDLAPRSAMAAREPTIIIPASTSNHGHAPAVDRMVTVAPGGFFARLTGTPSQSGTGAQAYKRPSLNLLHRPAALAHNPDITSAKLRDRSQLLLETLGDFGIKGDIVAVRPGPVVTLFEFEPARGTKSSRVIALADDIARSMSARAVRIAVVPGVNAIGIELPNANREPVGFRELLESEQFRASGAKLPLALGKGIGGNPIVADLTRMPHLLVAGTTGSGKSVGVNAMILSLLYQLSPADCRLILIDPKMLELSVYNGIPHLLTPVVTDPNKAIAALNWAVGEMETRYRRMSALSVRNIEVYNNRVRNQAKADDVLTASGEPHTPLPHIVIVVDEFADLMAVAGKEIEFAVQRLAQMARAAGIHLIMATQRPSVDIITGTIKANFPTRISFRVTSRIDSRTILNEQGAEQLLGQGDMLYAGGSGQIVRVHGPFVSDEEVEAIATHLRSLGAPAYVDGITDVPDDAQEKTADVLDEDHLYDRAVALVRTDRKASISYLQRKLGIGYNRSAGIVERMEQDGLVSPPGPANRRDVLLSSDTPPASPPNA